MADFSDIPDSDLEDAVHELWGDRAMEDKGNYINFVCPKCGTIPAANSMVKPKRKAYVYKDSWCFVCFKCTPMHHLMYELASNEEYRSVYRRLLFFQYGKNKNFPKEPKHERVYVKDAYNFKDGELLSLENTSDVDVRKAVEFCQSRKIREAVYRKWFVCKRDKKFYDTNPDGSLKLNAAGMPTGNEYGGRLIIPYYRFGGRWVQFDARALFPTELRYRNYTGAKRELYNGEFVHFNRPFYILEGAIDSTFIKNSVAIGGLKHFKTFIAENPDIEKYKDNCTLIFDCDKSGIDDLRAVMNMGFKWFDWTGLKNDNFNSKDYGKPVKDINEGVLNCSKFIMTDDGYVDPAFIASKTYPPEAGIMMLNLRYGKPKNC